MKTIQKEVLNLNQLSKKYYKPKQMKKIKKFDYYNEAREVEINDDRGKRRWDSCVYEVMENKLNEIIKTLNLLSEAKKK